MEATLKGYGDWRFPVTACAWTRTSLRLPGREGAWIVEYTVVIIRLSLLLNRGPDDVLFICRKGRIGPASVASPGGIDDRQLVRKASPP